MLLYELQHRVKNIISTISALAARTLRAGAPPEQFVEAFQGRLRGMAATHELLSRGNWRGAQLKELIETALRSHVSLEGGNVEVHGPDVLMMPNGASTLGMVFYELATNAVKYGALAGPGGHLDVSWRIVSGVALPPRGARLDRVRAAGRRQRTRRAASASTSSSAASSTSCRARRGSEPGPGRRAVILEFPVPQNLPSGR